MAAASAAAAAAAQPWSVWGALLFAAWAGRRSEDTRVGKQLSGALVATLLGLAFSNTGLIPSSDPVYGVVNRYLLPLAVPMLLFSADLRRVFRDTGNLLAIFLCGAVATVLGTVVAFRLVPLTSLGTEGWAVAAALCARHIGGAVNYVSVAEFLSITPSTQMAALAADNLLCALYFTVIYALVRNVPPEQAGGSDGDLADNAHVISVSPALSALALSAGICFASVRIAALAGLPGASIPIITAITVLLATALPQLLRPLVHSAEGIAIILMQVFFAAVGANGSIRAVVTTAPALFLFCTIQIAVHLLVILGAGRLLGTPIKDTVIASNANVGGPSTAAGMANAKGWRGSLVPAILVGSLGYSIATFIGVALGMRVLVNM